MTRERRTPTTRGGAALLAWLKAERRTQAWLAEQLRELVLRPVDDKRLHQTTISLWIGGTIPPADYASKIEEICGIPVSWWGEPAPDSGSGEHPAVAMPPTGTR